MTARPHRSGQGAGGLALVSPPVLFLTVWLVAIAITARVLTRPEANDLVHLFIARHRLDLAAFSVGPMIWALVLTGALGLGYALAGLGLAGRAVAPRPPQDTLVPPGIMAARVFWVNAVFLGVTALWVGMTMRAAGGMAAYIALAAIDPLGARDLLLDGKLFTGMRLLYAGLPATAALAAALLARGGLGHWARAACLAVLGINLIALFLLTLVMSQRLLVMQLVVASFVAASVARGRLVALWLVPVAVMVFAGGWLGREALTNPDLTRSASEIASQKFAFYAVNDLWNTVRPLAGDAPLAGGLFSLQFVFFFTLTNDAVYAANADLTATLAAFRGGGEFSLLSAPFVDFGPIGGAAYLLLYGALLRILWQRAGNSVGDAAIYAQAAVAVMLSVHANFAASQDFVFALLVILAVTRLPVTRARLAPRPHAAA
jgi:hypothetical protein